jgi:hypothetical protein
MTTEAEQMVAYLLDDPASWRYKTAALLRSQAAEIERLRNSLKIRQQHIDYMHKREQWYEELRKATDGGSESMTHDDALKQIEHWRGMYREIERLKAEANTCGSGAGCCAQAAEIERLKAEAELLAKHVGLKLARKDALIRRAWSVIRWQCFGECRTPGVAGLPTAAEVDDEIKTELG